VLCEAVEEYKRTNISHCSIKCHPNWRLSGQLADSFVRHAGYYGSVQADGTFFMIETIAHFEENQKVSYLVSLSWFFSGYKKPTWRQVKVTSGASFFDEKLTLALDEISLTFTPSAGSFSVQGTIQGNAIEARSFNLPVSFNNFGYNYIAKDGSCVLLTFNGTYNSIRSYDTPASDPDVITSFDYNPTKRVFEYHEGNCYGRLYLNAAAGHGLRLTFVQFNPEKLPGTTKFFYFSPLFDSIPGCVPPTGAEDLAAFAGFYPFQTLPFLNGFVNGFVSIVGTTVGTTKETVSVGIYLDGSPIPKEYTSFNFNKSTNTLTFPQDPDLTLKFQKAGPITRVTTGQITAINHFTPAPLSALGSFTLNDKTNKYSLQITIGNDGQSLVYKKNNINVFEPTTMFKYNAVEQDALVGEYVFNLTANKDQGITCAVTTVDQSGRPTGLQSVLHAFDNSLDGANECPETLL